MRKHRGGFSPGQGWCHLSLSTTKLPPGLAARAVAGLAGTQSQGSLGFPLQRWSGPEKLLALDELIDRCEPAQIKYMMQVIEPQFQRDFISLLPKEVSEAGGPGAGLT